MNHFSPFWNLTLKRDEDLAVSGGTDNIRKTSTGSFVYQQVLRTHTHTLLFIRLHAHGQITTVSFLSIAQCDPESLLLLLYLQQ